MKKSITPLLMFFAVLFVTCLLISNVAAAKMFQLGPWALTSGVLIFPISYIMSDVIAEVYGFKRARNIMWLGFGMNLLMVIYFQIAIALPAPVWYQNGDAFNTVLSSTPRVFIASLLAYAAGSYINAAAISKIKVMTKGKHFGVRAVISTVLGESVDSIIFISIAFAGTMPFTALWQMVVLQLIVKTVYEIIALPITTIVVRKVKKVEGIDTFDKGIKYGIVG